jgi:hypothetical protein
MNPSLPAHWRRWLGFEHRRVEWLTIMSEKWMMSNCVCANWFVLNVASVTRITCRIALPLVVTKYGVVGLSQTSNRSDRCACVSPKHWR